MRVLPFYFQLESYFWSIFVSENGYCYCTMSGCSDWGSYDLCGRGSSFLYSWLKKNYEKRTHSENYKSPDEDHRWNSCYMKINQFSPTMIRKFYVFKSKVYSKSYSYTCCPFPVRCKNYFVIKKSNNMYYISFKYKSLIFIYKTFLINFKYVSYLQYAIFNASAFQFPLTEHLEK